jgi:hypothetical protein
MNYQFYNAGDRIRDSFYFNLVGGADIHCLSKWYLDAPAQSFFEVPSVLVLANGSDVAVGFPKDVLNRYWKRGVVMIDPNSPFCADEGKPYAASKDEAIEKARLYWDQYIDLAVQNWIDQCQEARSVGGIMKQATGFTARALKLRRVKDPAAIMYESSQPAQPQPAAQSDEVKSLQEQLVALQKQMSAFMGEKSKEKAAGSNARQLEIEEALNTEPVPAARMKK